MQQHLEAVEFRERETGQAGERRDRTVVSELGLADTPAIDLTDARQELLNGAAGESTHYLHSAHYNLLKFPLVGSHLPCYLSSRCTLD